jgi:Domain of Unknown Function with PDB structure (DUF3862)
VVKMPAVTCPFCHKPATLPDPWTAPGYTCPHCGATVAIALPASIPVGTTPSPSAPQREVIHLEHRDRTPTHNAAAKGFGSAFGGCMGVFFATVVIFGGFCTLLYIGCERQAEQYRSSGSRGESPAPKETDLTITKTKYERIYKGMSYSEVCLIFGSNGAVFSETEESGKMQITWQWKNSDGSNTKVTFEASRVVNKEQIGLR